MKTTQTKKGSPTAIKIIHKCQLCRKKYKMWDDMVREPECPYCYKTETPKGQLLNIL